MDWETLKKRLLAAERIGFGRTVAVNVMDLTDAVQIADEARENVKALADAGDWLASYCEPEIQAVWADAKRKAGL